MQACVPEYDCKNSFHRKAPVANVCCRPATQRITSYLHTGATLIMTAGIPNRVGSYAEVAEDPDVEIVYVGMLHPFHYENALVALQNGKHVLVEKPSTCSLSDTRALAAMVRDCTNPSPPRPLCCYPKLFRLIIARSIVKFVSRPVSRFDLITGQGKRRLFDGGDVDAFFPRYGKGP